MVLLHFVSKQFSCAIDHWFYLWCDFLLVFFRVLLSFVGIFCWLVGVFYNIIVIFCFCLCIVTEYFILTLGILRNRMKKGFFCYQSLTLWHSFLLLIIDIRSALGRVAVYLWYREKINNTCKLGSRKLFLSTLNVLDVTCLSYRALGSFSV